MDDKARSSLGCTEGVCVLRMSDELWDVVVIGSGIIGSCAAYHSVKNGLRTLKIDQACLFSEVPNNIQKCGVL